MRKHAATINKHTEKGTYFFDYGNAFLLEASRAGADVMAENPTLGREFKFPSYVQDIMGPMCFDYGFGPFRWVCTSGKPEDFLTGFIVDPNKDEVYGRPVGVIVLPDGALLLTDDKTNTIWRISVKK